GLPSQAPGPVRRIRQFVGSLGPGGLGYLRDQEGYCLLRRGHLLVGGAAAVGQPVFDLAEAIGAEQLLQQRFLVLRVGAQEPGELALREQHDLEELLRRHADEVGDLLVRLADPGGLDLPGVGGALLEADRGLLPGGPAARLLLPVLFRPAGDAQAAAADRRLKLDLGRGGEAEVGVVRAQPPGGAPLPRYPSVPGERDRVEQRGLARAGLAVQQEQALQVVEDDLFSSGERAEGRHAEPVRVHQRCLSSLAALSLTAVNAAASSSRSAPVASVLRT